MDDLLTQAALIAAIVGVTKSIAVGTRAESIVNRVAPLSALIVAAAFVLVPTDIQTKITTITTLGLTAAGAYTLVKNKTGGNP
ncbi:hypothetical protein [Paenibacillus sp. SI8]|uniref:hypothetical protein n=1 Tax=unclassified Paenibacillus TaxID=185978 RepID=UPI0034661CE4